MTNEEFQKLVLEKLGGLEKSFYGLETRFDGMETRFDRLETEFGGLKTQIGGLETEFDGLKTQIGGLEKRFDGLEEQVKENTEIIKAVRHNQEFGIAKLSALELSTASKESIVKLDAKFDVLNDRLFQQEADLKILKAVK